MMQVALARMRNLWPEATIQVLTDDPDELTECCPNMSR